MGNIFVGIIISLLVLGVIAYANPHLWEDVKDKVMEKSVILKPKTTEPSEPSYNSIKPNVDIVKEVSVLFDGRQFLIKLPREISNFYELKKGDKIQLRVNVKQPPEKHINYFEIIKKWHLLDSNH